ncbi:MAG: hypothetical protein ACHQVS_02515 [Candidatus Babeliales bacterium]
MAMMNSFIHIKNAQVRNASNDGMELLGHFLLGKVGVDAHFFIMFFEDAENGAIASGAYFLEKLDDMVYLEHLESSKLMPFETTRRNFIDILKRWQSACKSPTSSACNAQGSDLIIIRSLNGRDFSFDTQLPDDVMLV